MLVATDIAARGIHVDDVEPWSIHLDPPTEHKAYLHRSGRTARAGATGTVVTVVLPDQARDVRALAKQAGINPVTVQVRPGSPEITALTGPPAPYVEPQPEPVQPRQTPSARSDRPRHDTPRTARAGGPRRSGSRTTAGRSSSSGPARTRAELAARAGQPPSPRRRAR